MGVGIYFKPIIYKLGLHQPMNTATEQSDPTSIPLSSRTVNSLVTLPDGIYSGNILDSAEYYVDSSNGVDATTSGTLVAPYRTLDYALAQLTAKANGLFTQTATIALKANETFSLGSDFINAGNLTISFYGDSNYGSFDSPNIGTGAHPSVLIDLARPVISPTSALVSTQWKMFGIRNKGLGTLTLQGVQINLAGKPVTNPDPSTYGGYSDFITNLNYSQAT